MQNFGRGMWRRVGDFDKLRNPQIQKECQIQQYLILLEHNRLNKIKENNNKTMSQNITSESSIVEEFITEEPIVTSIVEEPIVTAIVEEPIVTAIVEEFITEEPIVEEPIVEELIVEEPIVEEPIVEELIVEEPIIKEPIIIVPKKIKKSKKK